MPVTLLDLSTLDEGIRDAVSLLTAHGYTTTDSGDGSKATWMEGALPFRHVVCICAKDRMIVESERVPTLPWSSPPTLVEATFSPLDGRATILVGWVTP